MDDNSNFEQQFRQNLQATPTPPRETPKHASPNSKLPLIIAIILAVIVLLETFALVITLSNYFGVFEYGSSEEETYDEEVFFREETSPEDGE